MKKSSKFWRIASHFTEASNADKYLLTRLYEGDMPDDDNDDDQNNAPVNDGGAAPSPSPSPDSAPADDFSDGGGDDFGGGGNDFGGDSGGMGGSDGGGGDINGGSDIGVEEQIDNANASNDAALNIPNDLVLNDGTETDISVDSNFQDEPLISGETEPIQFEDGNWGSFRNSAIEYSNDVSSVVQQFVPLVEVALIELLGNSNSYKRVSFEAQPVMDGNETTINVDLRYQTSIWLGTDIPLKSLQLDQNYIRNRVSVLPNVNIKIASDGITINPNEGTLHIQAVLTSNNNFNDSTMNTANYIDNETKAYQQKLG